MRQALEAGVIDAHVSERPEALTLKLRTLSSRWSKQNQVSKLGRRYSYRHWTS